MADSGARTQAIRDYLECAEGASCGNLKVVARLTRELEAAQRELADEREKHDEEAYNALWETWQRSEQRAEALERALREIVAGRDASEHSADCRCPHCIAMKALSSPSAGPDATGGA